MNLNQKFFQVFLKLGFRYQYKQKYKNLLIVIFLKFFKVIVRIYIIKSVNIYMFMIVEVYYFVYRFCGKIIC